MDNRFKYLLLMGGMMSVEDATQSAHARGKPSKAYTESQNKAGLSRKERRKQEALARKGKSNDKSGSFS